MLAKFKNYRMTQTTFFFSFYKKVSNIFDKASTPAMLDHCLKSLHNTVKHNYEPNNYCVKKYTTCVKLYTICVKLYTSCVFFYTTVGRFICFTVLCKVLNSGLTVQLKTFLYLKQMFDAKLLIKDVHLSVFQKLRWFDTCNQVKSCSKHDRPHQSHEKQFVPAPYSYSCSVLSHQTANILFLLYIEN